MIGVEVDLESISQAILDEVVSAEQLLPAMIEIDCDHTIYVEFGTGPVTATTSTPHPKSARNLGNGVIRHMSDMEYNLFRWVGRVNPGISINDQLYRSYRLYKKICEKGLEARPFIRPAVYEAQDSVVDRILAGETLLEVAESIKDRMIELLDANTLASAKNDSSGEYQSLQNSITVRLMEPSELDMELSMPDAAKKVPSEEWSNRSI